MRSFDIQLLWFNYGRAFLLKTGTEDPPLANIHMHVMKEMWLLTFCAKFCSRLSLVLMFFKSTWMHKESVSVSKQNFHKEINVIKFAVIIPSLQINFELQHKKYQYSPLIQHGECIKYHQMQAHCLCCQTLSLYFIWVIWACRLSCELMRDSSEGWLERHKVNQKVSQSVSSSAQCKVCKWILRSLDTKPGSFNEYNHT